MARMEYTALDQIPESQLRKLDPSHLRKLLRESIESGLFFDSPARCNEMRLRVLALDLSKEAIRWVQQSPTLNRVIQGKSSDIGPEKARRIRYWFIRLLVRAGHSLFARRLLELEPPQTAEEFLVGGSSAIAFGDLKRGLPFYKKAFDLDPGNLVVRFSCFHALAHAEAGGPGNQEAIRGLQELLQETAAPENRLLVGVRLAEALRLWGKPAEALRLIDDITDRFSAASAADRNASSIAKIHLDHERASCHAALGDAGRSRALFDQVLREAFLLNFSYTNLIFIYRRIRAAGVARPEEVRLLAALSLHLKGFDPEGQFRAPESAFEPPIPSESGPFQIDLARDEYQIPGEAGIKLGIPLELQAAAWISLGSAPIRFIEKKWHPGVRRTLLMDLLWPDEALSVSQLEARLSQLLARCESVYGFELRDRESDLICASDDMLQKVQVRISPQPEVPTFLEKLPSGERPTATGVAAFYGVSPSRGRVILRNWENDGTLHRCGRSRSPAKRRRSA